MRFLSLMILTLLLVARVAIAADKVPAWVEPMRKLHAEFDGDRNYVAQFGDSITTSLAFWSPLGWDDPEKYLPDDDGLPKKPADKRWRDVIQGVRDKGSSHGNDGGWRVENILSVQDKVLKEKRPAVAIIMVGTNDVRGDKIPSGYEEGLARIVDNCLAAKCIPLLTTIPPMRDHDKAVGEANEIIKRLAADRKIPLIDYYAAILERRPGQTWDKTLISADGVHPSAGKTNVYSAENLQIDGYALRNWVTFLKFREVYFHVLAAGDLRKPIQVLLVGNSQCPTIVSNQLLEKLAASDKEARPIKVTGCIKGGASLRSHWDAGTGPKMARGMIASKAFDFVVLQDIYLVEEAAFQPYARNFHELIKENGAQTVLFGTASILSDYPKGFDRLHRLHMAMGKELSVPIVDASQAYFRYFGDKPSAELMESLFAKDRAHPGLQGSYLYSCGIYSVLTGRSPVGLAAPEAIPADVAKRLQEAAWAQHQETAEALKK